MHTTDRQSTIAILVQVDANVPDGTMLFNQASVFSDIFDPDNGGNMATEDTPVARSASCT